MSEKEKSKSIPEEQRIARFTKHFKNYLSVSTFVVASLPIPITQLHLIPMYHKLAPLLSTFASLFCFLLLALLFSVRHRLARIMFGEMVSPSTTEVRIDNPVEKHRTLGRTLPSVYSSIFPLVLAGSALFFALIYLRVLHHSVGEVKKEIYGLLTEGSEQSSGKAGRDRTTALRLPKSLFADPSPDNILRTMEFGTIPNQKWLILSYLFFFLSAEAAFVVMAIREYLQDLLGFSDSDLIYGAQRAVARDSAGLERIENSA